MDSRIRKNRDKLKWGFTVKARALADLIPELLDVPVPKEEH